MESLRIYHGPAKHGWDGLASGDMYCEGSIRIRRAKPEECMPTGGSHTNQPIAIEPNVGVGDIKELLRGTFVFFIFFVCGFRI